MLSGGDGISPRSFQLRRAQAPILGEFEVLHTDPHHSSFDDRDFVAYSILHLDIGTFSTLEDLGDELHKWIFVERDFDMLQLRLLSMKTIAYHLYDKTDEQSFSFSRKWMLLTNRGGRSVARRQAHSGGLVNVD